MHFKYHKFNSYFKGMIDQIQTKFIDGIQRLLPIHIKATALLLADTFLVNNELWKSFSMQKGELLKYFESLLENHLLAEKKSQEQRGRNVPICLVNIRGSKAMSCMLHYTLAHYLSSLQQPTSPLAPPQLKLIDQLNPSLFKGIDLASYPPQTTLFCTNFAKNIADQTTTQRKLEILVEFHRILKEGGFTHVISRVTNPKIMEGNKRMGSKVLNEVVLEYQGSKFPVFLMATDLYNPLLLKLQEFVLSPKL